MGAAFFSHESGGSELLRLAGTDRPASSGWTVPGPLDRAESGPYKQADGTDAILRCTIQFLIAGFTAFFACAGCRFGCGAR
jgi:hypothetical protein